MFVAVVTFPRGKMKTVSVMCFVRYISRLKNARIKQRNKVKIHAKFPLRPGEHDNCMGHWSSFPSAGSHGRPQEAIGGHGFVKFRVGHYHWDRLGKPWEATEGHSGPWVRYFWVGHDHWDRLESHGRPRNAMGWHEFGNSCVRRHH